MKTTQYRASTMHRRAVALFAAIALLLGTAALAGCQLNGAHTDSEEDGVVIEKQDEVSTAKPAVATTAPTLQSTPAPMPTPMLQPTPAPTPVPTPATPTLTPETWQSSYDFENALLGPVWEYVQTVPLEELLTGPGYEDMTMSAAAERTFLAIGQLHSVIKDGDVITSEYDREYFFDGETAYVWLGEYQGYMWDPDFVITKPMPEMRMQYYIDTNGFLIQTLQVYYFQTDDYTLASDANVYEPAA